MTIYMYGTWNVKKCLQRSEYFSIVPITCFIHTQKGFASSTTALLLSVQLFQQV